MKIPKNLGKLTKLFEKLGAPVPEDWARSQIEEDSPQLQRFLFLRQAWAEVLGDEEVEWVDAMIEVAEDDPSEPFAGVGLALKRAVAAGVAKQDLVDIARGVQAELLFQFCCLLDDPGLSEPEVEDLEWGLFEVDENGDPIPTRIERLQEDVLAMDPTGREMRPPSRR